jgi:hypothetical protein
LAQEIDRDQGEAAIGRHDEERPVPDTQNTHSADRSGNSSSHRPTTSTGNGPRQGSDEPASNKQVQFLLTLSKRFKLSTPQLEHRINQIIGRKCSVYDLTKKEAAKILDQFTNGGSGNGQEAR